MFSKSALKIGAVLSAVVILLCGCATRPQDNGKLNVTVTVFPLFDFVRAVGRDLVNITLLIKPGTEVHSFDPKPSDIIAVKNADLFFEIGGESEEWVEKLSDSQNKNAVRMMDYVELIEEEDEPGEYDEHIWTSPSNAIIMIEKVCDELSLVDKKNSQLYEQNAQNYIESIRQVSDEIERTVEQSQSKFILVADRFPFAYFVNEFGIDYAAAFGGCAVNTDISIKAMNFLMEEIRDRGCTAIYCIEMSDRKIANALSEETGVRIWELHSAHNVTLDEFKAGRTYLDIIKSNAKVLERGML